MNWARYSWKAITCCVSKGVLILLSGSVGMALLFSGLERYEKRQEIDARAMKHWCWENDHRYLGGTLPKHLVAQYEDNCALGRAAPKKVTMAVKVIILAVGGICLFGFLAALLAGICQGSIAYCQAAVDTGRRPWYWVPWIGDPLPPRELVACESCGHASPESDDEYRKRLGLPPLDELPEGRT